MAEYVKIGKLVSTFGVSGEMILKHHLGKRSALKGQQALFIEEKKSAFIPWFIDKAAARKDDEVLLKFEGVDTKEAAARLLQKEIWVVREVFEQLSSAAAPARLLGFTIVDGTNPVGEIVEIIEQPHQVLCRVQVGEKEALIPLHEETIRKIDRRNKQIIVELPEGLLEIYL